MRNSVGAICFFLAWGCGQDRDQTVVFDRNFQPKAPLAAGTNSDAGTDVGLQIDAGRRDAAADAVEVADASGASDAAMGFPLPVGLKGLPASLSDGQRVPQWLSEVGVFSDLGQLVPSPSLIAYDVQAPLFSDSAIKSRWIALPEGTTIGFRGLNAWEFPLGTVFIKQFDMVLDEREPGIRTRLETRLLVAGEGGEFYGLTYRWNEQATDAQVVLESTTIELAVTDTTGSARPQSYLLPSPQDCLACHGSRVGWALGVRSIQLHSARSEAELAADQLMQLSARGVFDRELSAEEVLALPSLAGLDDEARSVEDRVRSYLDSNCAHCHGSRENFFIPFDARYATPLADQGIVWGAAANPKGGPDSQLVVPGSWENSELYLRDSSVSSGVKMPPLGRNIEDEAYLVLLRQWIVSLQGDPRFSAP